MKIYKLVIYFRDSEHGYERMFSDFKSAMDFLDLNIRSHSEEINFATLYTYEEEPVTKMFVKTDFTNFVDFA